MKKILIGLMLLAGASATLSSCKDDSVLPALPMKSMPVIFPVITQGKSFINYDSVRLGTSSTNLARRTRQSFEFSFTPTEQRDLKLEAVEVYRSYRRGAILGPRLLVGTYNSFPAVVKMNYNELLADGPGGAHLQRYNGETLTLARPANPDANNNFLLENDAVVFTFEYIAEGGQRIVLTPLNAVGAPTGTFINEAYTATAVFRKVI